MKDRNIVILAAAGAGVINGILGAGGGMVLIPCLTYFTKMVPNKIFPTSVAIILPLTVLTFITSGSCSIFSYPPLPGYLIGSGLGGFIAGRVSGKIPIKWLHWILGILITAGGIRTLC